MRRRTLIAMMAGSLVSPACLGDAPRAGVRDEDPDVVARLRDHLKLAGVGPMRGLSTRYYLSAGDIAADDRLRIGQYCDALLGRGRAMFAKAGIPLKEPTTRLNVVAIADREAYGRLATLEHSSPGAPGFYTPQVRTVFLTPVRQERSTQIDWEPTMRIVAHEAMHQITMTLGPLDPLGDIPPCIAEGMAILADDGSDRSPSLAGGIPGARRAGVEAVRANAATMADLFASDDRFYDPNGRALRYAQSWLLVRTLMTAKDLSPKFREYLATIPRRVDDTHRVADARAHFGDLDALLSRIVTFADRLLRQPTSRFQSPRRPTEAEASMR